MRALRLAVIWTTVSEPVVAEIVNNLQLTIYRLVGEGTEMSERVRPTSWAPPGDAFWGGRWQSDGDSLTVLDPEDGRVVGAVRDCSAEEVSEAVRGVAHAVQTGPLWPIWQRREALYRAAQLLDERREHFARLISTEGCKPISSARGEAQRAIETVRLSAEQADRLEGRTLPFGNTPRGDMRVGWYTRKPVGVVGAITPFNDPLNLVAHKLGPALIGGNGVVLKPAEATPLTALAFLEVLLEAGIPADRIAVVPGVGATAGVALVGHPQVDMVSFTGGWATGDAVARAAGAKKTSMELGGIGAVLVLPDGDADAAAHAIVDGAFGNAGQNCLSVQRVFLAEELAEPMTRRIEELTGRLVVGTKRDDATDVGPLIDVDSARRVESWVDEAVATGARVLVGGKRDGAFYWPTVLTDVPVGARVLEEEIFGPVVLLETFSDRPEAIRTINDLDFGLQAGVFTQNIDTALEVASMLRVGAVMINDTGDYRIDAMPFGGAKRSGIGREGVPFAVDAMTEPKIIAINRSA